MNDRLIALVQQQAQNELSNFLTYEIMFLDSEQMGFFGLAKFCQSQAKGEKEHHDTIISYMNDANIPSFPIISQIREPYTLSMLPILAGILKLEQKTTEEINAICACALDNADFQTFASFHTLALEQVEEIKKITDILAKYRQRSATGDPSSAELDIDLYIGGL